MPDIDEKEIKRRFEAISQFELSSEVTTRDLERIRESLTAQMSKQQARPGTMWTIIMRSPITKIAAAAVIIIAALVFVNQFGGSIDGTTVALAEVKDAVEKMPWIHAVIKEYYKGNEKIKQHWLHFSSKEIFEKTSDGYVSYLHQGPEPKWHHYNPSTQTITITDASDGDFYGSDSAYSLISAIVQYIADEGASIKQYHNKHNGRDVQVYEIEKVGSDKGIGIIGETIVVKIRYRFMADIKSKLMVAAGTEWLDKNDEVIKYSKVKVDYPETGPEGIYALGVPRTVKLVDKTDVAEGRRPR